MEANEVRKGNLVDFRGQTETVYQIRNSGVCFFRGTTKTGIITQSYTWEAIKPIPLTEEWLLKFGFRHIMNNWYNIHANNNTFNVYLFDEIGYRVEIVSQSIAVLKYTHQLQNLFFCLCGEELMLKDN